jgi:hypothetical protein
VVSKQGVLVHDRLHHAVQDATESGTWLLQALHTFAWSKEVRRLAGHGNDLPVSLSLSLSRPAVGNSQPCYQGATAASSVAWIQQGPFEMQDAALQPANNDCISFTLSNKDDKRSWYAYILAIGPDFAVKSVFPGYRGDDEARLGPNELYLVKDTFYRIDQGEQIFMLLVSEAPLHVSALLQNGVARSGASESHLERLLWSAAERRDATERSDIQVWGAQAALFEIPRQSTP